MDARRLFNVTRSRVVKVGSIAAVFGALLTAHDAAARAAVREAVKRALPATVAVEWRDAAQSASVPKAGTPMNAFKATAAPGFSGRTASGRAGGADQLRMASGTIVSADGQIVTMIGSYEDGQYVVTLGDGKSLPARLLVDDRRTGLQLLKIDVAGLPFLIPSRQPVPIGEEVTWAYCLDPKDRAAGQGIVAAVGRELKGMGDDLLQLDAGVGMISAGAPLVDDAGRLLGIIAFNRASPSQRLGFALPVAAIDSLLAARKGDEPAIVRRGMLGVYLTPDGKDEGRVVAHPANDSPAAAAGVRDGDEILAVDGSKVDSLSGLGRLVAARAAGQKIRLTIRRDGKEHEIEVTLAPGQAENAPTPVAPAGIGPAPKPPVSVVTPDSIYIIDGEGKLHSLSGQATEKSLENLRDHYQRLSKLPKGAIFTEAGSANVAVPSIRVERSNMEKKLEEIGRDVQSLRQQMEKLTEELQRLQKPSAGTAPKP
jgi:S1-C subfamily serine protease